MNKMILITDRLILRPPTLSDAVWLNHCINLPEINEYMENLPHAAVDDTITWINYDAENGYTWLIQEHHSDIFCGCVALEKDSDSMSFELGYWMLPEFRNRGYTREACEALLKHAASVFGGIKVYAQVDVSNTPSMSLLDKLGFLRGNPTFYDKEDGSRRFNAVYFYRDLYV